MKTIIVPVDFSPASLNAVNYAFDLAVAIKAELRLYHVYTFPLAVSEVPVAPLSIQELIDEADKTLQQLKTGLLHKTTEPIKISVKIEEGLFSTLLENYCQSVQPYAVVMGFYDKSAVERVLFGSNTLYALRNLSWPLLLVPTGTRFSRISRIGLACDLINVPQSVHADKIISLVKEFNARLDILHITPPKHGLSAEETTDGAEWLASMLAEVNPVFHFMQNENIEEAITGFSEKNNLDILIIIPKHHGLLDGLLHSSHSKKMVLHTHIPILSMHE